MLLKKMPYVCSKLFFNDKVKLNEKCFKEEHLVGP
jgi:hypothetical protein